MLARTRILSSLLIAGLALLSPLVVSGQASAAVRGFTRSNRAARAGAWLAHLSGSAVGGLTPGTFSDPLGFGLALVGSAPAGDGPSLLAVDSATHTAYVVDGDNLDGPNQGGDTVSVIDLRRCNARDVSRCPGPWPTVTVGNIPASVAVDTATDTVYVANTGDFVDPSTVSVFNGATCNAEDQRGCGQAPAQVPVGIAPLGIDADSANHTVYVANLDYPSGNTVSMINSATCNGAHLSDCPSTEPPTVTVGDGPGDIDVDQATHTAYVAQTAGVAVFDADTCNAATQSGCGTVATLTNGDTNGVVAATVDPANQTLYTANGDDTLSVFDLRDCTAADLGGCATDTPATVSITHGVPGLDAALGVAADTANHTIYAPFFHDDALMAIDADACNGHNPAGCATVVPREIHTGAEPESVALDPETQTLYTGDEVDDAVSVINASACDAQTSTGCRPAPPMIAFPQPGVPADDPAVHTLYIPSQTGAVGMLDTNVCNAARPAACPAAPVTFTGGDDPQDAILDEATHTVYIANAGSGSDGSVSVIDDLTCNAGIQTGCGTIAHLQVPTGADPIAVDVDVVTNTVYVAADASAEFGAPTDLYVFNGATCDAQMHGGCRQTPLAVPLGTGAPANVAVDQATNTVYVAMVPSFGTDTPGSVAVIDGATCNATQTAGCTGPIASIPVGVDPEQVGVDQASDTIYTANAQDFDYPGTVSVINGAVCNAGDQDGCGQSAATAPVGFGPLNLWVDQAHNQIWVENNLDTSVSIIDGTACNGQHETACARQWPQHSVLDYPDSAAFADGVNSAYIGGGTGISILALTPNTHQ
ncbi:MAG: YncE family protein [Solirubrobacteraceae bacterium]